MTKQTVFFQRIKPRLYKQFWDIAARRQAGVRFVMEQVSKLGNLGAIARSCDGLGIQQVAYLATESGRKHQRSLVSASKGANQWLTYTSFEDTGIYIDQLRRTGWHVFATSSVVQGKPLHEVDFARHKKVVLMVGSESNGLSETALVKADERITIPMQGFTESFNVSVAAALVLREIVRQRQAAHFFLDKDAQEALVDEFVAVYFKKHANLCMPPSSSQNLL